ncbi:MAG: methionyl-tRNA formyltransferase [bacterium]
MRILFVGTGDIGVPSLRFLAENHTLIGVLTQPDRPAGRHRELKSPAIKEALLHLDPDVPLLQPESPRLPGVAEWIGKLRPEVMVTMAYGRILPRELLESPSLACLNIHASLLPRHRGAAPIQATIASGDKVSGITIMYMAEGLDTGDVLLEKRCSLRRRETAGSLSEKLAKLAPLALDESLVLLSQGKAPRIPQDDRLATVTGKITREDCLLDWNRSARELECKIRSLQPRPAAVAMLPLAMGGTITIKIHSSIVARQASGKPGTILRSDSRGILVACGEEGMLLGEIQPEGRGRMHSSAYARGAALSIAG